MKKVYSITLFLLSLLLFWACPPNPIDKECPPYCNIDSIDTTTVELPYELVWQKPLFMDTLYSLTGMNNVYVDGKFIASKRKGPNYNEIIVAYDAQNGEMLWEWDDYLDEYSNYFKSNAYLDNGILYESTTREVIGLNLNSGQTIMHTIEHDLIPSTKISFTANSLFQTYDQTILDNPVSKLVVYNFDTESWNTVYQINKTDDFGVYLEVPSSSINQQNDIILYSHNRKYKPGPYGNKTELIAYNWTADTILWKAVDYDTTVYAVPNSHNPPIIEGDCIYSLLDKALYCFNKNTGELIWSRRIENSGNFDYSNYVLCDYSISFVSTTGHLIGIHKSTGTVLYNIDHGAGIDYIRYYNGRLYYTSGKLYIADANSGELLYKLKTHNYSQRTPGSFANGIDIDPENGLLFLNDGFFAMCIKIPE